MTDNLAAALAAVQADLPTVAKARTADIGTYSYTYADLADVAAAVMPLLSKHGLAFTTCPRMTERGYELVGYLMHTSGEEKEGALPIQLGKATEMGSSITYMRRYLLGCMTGVVTEDDDDGRRANKRAEEQARQGEELNAAKRAVRAAWVGTGADWDPAEVARAFQEWDGSGQDLKDASVERLYAFRDDLSQAGDGAADVADSPQDTAPSSPPPQSDAGPKSDTPASRRGYISPKQVTALSIALTDAGFTDRDQVLDWIEKKIGRRVESRKDLTSTEAKRLLDDALFQARAAGGGKR